MGYFGKVLQLGIKCFDVLLSWLLLTKNLEFCAGEIVFEHKISAKYYYD